MAAIDHRHDAETNATRTRAVGESPSPWLALRVILSIGAAVLLLVGSFLEWANGTDGSALSIRSYWETDAGSAESFLMSAGIVTAICGAVIILGLAFRGGWLTRFAGAVALVAFTLVVVQLGREGSLDTIEDVGIGLWFVLAGGVLALIGGFLPSTRTVDTVDRSEDVDADVDTVHTRDD